MMKKILYLFTLLVTLTITANAQSADEKAVDNAGKLLNRGLINQDIKLLNRLVLPNLSYGHSSGAIENKAAFTKAVADGPVRYISIDVADQTITITGNVAVTRQIQTLKLINDGKPTDLKIGNMLVWKKVQNTWKLLAKQGFKL